MQKAPAKANVMNRKAIYCNDLEPNRAGRGGELRVAPPAGRENGASERAARGSEIALAIAIGLLVDGTLSIDVDGRIWRHFIRRGDRRFAIQPRRAEFAASTGHLALQLWDAEGQRNRNVFAHVVIWVSLNGPVPAGLQIAHLDLDKRNNRPGNLALMTGAQVIAHFYACGAPWQSGPALSRDLETLHEIARQRASGTPWRAIADPLGYTPNYVRVVSKATREKLSDPRPAMDQHAGQSALAATEPPAKTSDCHVGSVISWPAGRPAITNHELNQPKPPIERIKDAPDQRTNTTDQARIG